MGISVAALKAQAAQATGAPTPQCNNGQPQQPWPADKFAQGGWQQQSPYSGNQGTQGGLNPPSQGYGQQGFGAPQGFGPAPAFGGAPVAGQTGSADEPKVLGLNPTERQHAIQSLLPGREYWVGLDQSASMNAKDISIAGGQATTRWLAIAERASTLALTAEKYDPNGLTIVEFGSTVKVTDNVRASEVKRRYAQAYPNGGTNLIETMRVFKEAVLKSLDESRQRGQKPKAFSFIIFTDGEPSAQYHGQDARAAVRHEIKQLAEGLRARGGTDQDVAISFIQIGNDEEAMNFLNELDEGLGRELNNFDIVDTKHWNIINQHRLTDDELLVDGILD